MQRLKIGDRLQIQCYKHDGKIHREWEIGRASCRERVLSGV